MKTEMTPKERMSAFAKGMEIDRVVTIPNMGVTMSHFIGKRAIDHYTYAEVMADLEVALFKRLQHDAVNISTSLRGVAEAMGAKVSFPENNISYLEVPAINSPKEVDKLEVCNPLKDGHLPMLLKAIELTYEALIDEVNVTAALAGPLSVASSIVGTENLLKWMLKYPKELHQVMEVVTESNNRYIDEVAKFGISMSFSDPVSSTSLISQKQFQTFSLPYLKKNIDHIKAKTNRSPGIHICGKSKEIWLDVVNAGITNFSIDNVEDIAEAKEIIGDKAIITGNVPPVDIVHLGTKEDIFASVKECIKKGYDSPKGYILNTGCQIPMNTPIEKVEMFMEAANIYGKYPIQLD